MEERLIDEEKGRKITLKRTVEGEQDAVEGEVIEEEVLLTYDDEYDEDLVGLTPSQLKKALEERQRAKEEAERERDSLVKEGDEAMSAGDFAHAEACYQEALVYDEDCIVAERGVWSAITRRFEDLEPLFEYEIAERVSLASEGAKAFIRERAGDKLRALRKEYEAEYEPLAQTVGVAQSERREAFGQNRTYYLRRFLIALACFFATVIGTAVSAYFIVRTRSNLPLILTIVFGVLTLVAFIVLAICSRKLYVAGKLYSDNEKASSTGDGLRLQYLTERLECLSLVLDD